MRRRGENARGRPGQRGAGPPRAPVKVRRGLGPSPARTPRPLRPPPGHRARSAATTRRWMTARRPPRSAGREGAGGPLSQAHYAPGGQGRGSQDRAAATPQPQLTRRAGPPGPHQRDCACAAVPPAGAGPGPGGGAGGRGRSQGARRSGGLGGRGPPLGSRAPGGAWTGRAGRGKARVLSVGRAGRRPLILK